MCASSPATDTRRKIGPQGQDRHPRAHRQSRPLDSRHRTRRIAFRRHHVAQASGTQNAQTERRARSARQGELDRERSAAGMAEEQFTDDPRGFPLAELDQPSRRTIRWPCRRSLPAQRISIRLRSKSSENRRDDSPDPPGGKDRKGRRRQADRRAFRGAGGVAFVAVAKIPLAGQGCNGGMNTRELVTDLNSMGMTGMAGCRRPRHGRTSITSRYQYLAGPRRAQHARFFWTDHTPARHTCRKSTKLLHGNRAVRSRFRAMITSTTSAGCESGL